MDILTCTGRYLHELGITEILHIFQPEYDLTQLLFAMNISATVWSKPTGSDDRYDSYLISCRDLKYVEPILQTLSQTKFYNSSSLVLAVYHGNMALVNDLFALFWSHYMSNVLVLTASLRIFTYYPISRGQCKYTDAVYLGVCGGVARPNESRSRSFWGCKLNSYSFPSAPFVQLNNPLDLGLEVYILKELQLRIGFEVVEVSHNYTSWGTVQNGVYTMSLLDLHSGKVDIVYGGMVKYYNRCRLFECTFTHCISYTNFFVPQPRKVEPWKNIFLVFTVDVWLSILSSLLLTSGLWVVLKKDSYCTMLEMLLTVTKSKPKHLNQRLVFISWAFGAFLLVNYYESRMISYLFRPTFAPHISTLDQLVDSKLKHGGLDAAKAFFPKVSPTYTYIHENWIDCGITALQCYSRMSLEKDFAMFKTLRFIYKQDSINRTTNSQKLDNDILTEVSFYMRKGSPLKNRMDELIFRMWDAGLIEKWDVYRKFVRYVWVNPRNQPIDVNKLLSAFLLYGTGLLVSICAFCIEVVALGYIIYF